jgi:hypothetical protein
MRMTANSLRMMTATPFFQILYSLQPITRLGMVGQGDPVLHPARFQYSCINPPRPELRYTAGYSQSSAFVLAAFQCVTISGPINMIGRKVEIHGM